MKKKLFIVAITSIILTLTFSLGVLASSKITLIVNGTTSKVEPVSIDGVTYVPLRAAAEMLGVKVKWDSKTNTVTLTSNEVAASSNSNSKTNEASNTNSDSTTTIDIVYKSCADVKAAGKAPIKKGQPGYSTKLDRDGDGIACET